MSKKSPVKSVSWVSTYAISFDRWIRVLKVLGTMAKLPLNQLLKDIILKNTKILFFLFCSPGMVFESEIQDRVDGASFYVGKIYKIK